jgi:general secretion pathway protein D
MNRHADDPPASGFASSGAIFRIALFAVLAVLGLSSLALHAESANAFYNHGQKAEVREDYDAAVDNYQKAFKKDPKDLRYRAAYYRVRITASVTHLSKGNKLLSAGDEQGALTEFLHAIEIDPSNEAAQQAIDLVRKKHGEVAPVTETSLPEVEGKQEDLDSMGAPPALRPVSNEPVTLHMQEDSKVVYQAIGKAAGVNILFDPDYTAKRIQVDLTNVSLLDALRIVGTISNTFWRPVTENTVFVAANTPNKRKELDEQAVQTFYLSNAWQENDLTDVQTAIRNVLINVKATGVKSQNAIVVRGTPDELLLVQKLINDLDKARPEVIVDISVLEVSKNWEKNLGITWPSSATVALQTDIDSTSASSTSTVTATKDEATLYNLAHLKANNFLATISAAKANLLLTDANTKILDNPRIRCTDGQKATMKIGEKIPVATGSYSTGTSTTSVSGLVNTQFQYQDVGVNIEMTPTVHFDHDVTLKIKLEDSSEGTPVTMGSGSDSISEPTIIQKTSEQVIRLREGEASIMSGMVNKTDTVSWTGVPGLSSIPGLKYLFGSKDHTITEDEIVFLVVPHVVRSQSLEQVNLRTIDTGVGSSIELRRVPVESASPQPAPKPAPVPARPQSQIQPNQARPNIGIFPNQTAEAAGPAALAQMRATAETEMSRIPAATPPKSAPQPPAGVSFTFGLQSGPVAIGATFKVPVALSGGVDIASVPLQIQYDPAKLSLVNVDSGDFLGRDGQPVALIHRDDGPGTLYIGASRPPGAPGVSGTGVICVLSFQAKAAGESAIVITHPGAVSRAQRQLPAQGARVSIQVR